jgi:uncharacterized protein (DUF1330 family)
MMAAYIVVEIDVKDPAVFEEYKKLSPATIKQYGGKYLARGGSAGGRMETQKAGHPAV